MNKHAELGRLGGKKTSDAKASAARLNGLKGGWPKKASDAAKFHLKKKLKKLLRPKNNALDLIRAR